MQLKETRHASTAALPRTADAGIDVYLLRTGLLEGLRREPARLAALARTVAPRYRPRDGRTDAEALSRLAAGLLLRIVCDVCEDDQLLRTDLGKPFLARDGAPKISLSHCDGGAVLALARMCSEVGVDIELGEPADYSALKHSLPPAFLKHALCPFGQEAPRSLCTQIWTRVEAASKCSGIGLAAARDTLARLLSTLAVDTFSLEPPEEPLTISCASELPAPIALWEIEGADLER